MPYQIAIFRDIRVMSSPHQYLLQNSQSLNPENVSRLSNSLSLSLSLSLEEKMEISLAAVTISIAIAVVSWWVWRTLKWVWFKPKMIESYLRRQGLSGTPYTPLVGDLMRNSSMMAEARSKPIKLTDDIRPRVVPYPLQMLKTHGRTFFTWFGHIPTVTIMDPEQIKEVFNKVYDFPKTHAFPLGRLIAAGLVSYDGDKWAKHRRIINPAFHLEKIKIMVPAFHQSCSEVVGEWDKLVSEKGSSCEVDVWPGLVSLTADVISRTAFGSSYKEGQRIFELQAELGELIIKVFRKVVIPGYMYLPTKDNRRIKAAAREVQVILRGIVDKRLRAREAGEAPCDDLLGILLESNRMQAKGNGMSIKEVMEECKLFYFAGQETTTVLLVWTMVLLSQHQDWQARAREEVKQVFGDKEPDADGLNHLKVMTMILYEVLRLYPPVTQVTRTIHKETKLGDLTLPAGVHISLPILLVQRDTELWGDDAAEFKPERFSEGLSKATKSQVSFFPFTWGPRVCIGQNFALLEAKMAMSLILQRFSFELSPSYVHAPYPIITIHPEFVTISLVMWWTWKTLKWVWLKPKMLELYLRGQGLPGTPYTPLVGDFRNFRVLMKARTKPINLTDDIIPRVMPVTLHMLQTHGRTFFTWLGPTPIISIMDPEQIKQVFNRVYDFQKPHTLPLARLIATGLVFSDGDKWAKHRRIINPAFHRDKIKNMVPTFHRCCIEVVSEWEKLVSDKGTSCEVDVWPWLLNLSADVISRTAFGSSYKQGQRIFQLQAELAQLIILSVQKTYIPGWQYLPTKSNRRMIAIDREIQAILRRIISNRETAIEAGEAPSDDLLSILLESNLGQAQGDGMSIEDVIEECKLFYIAGQETTSVLLVWTMVLLSQHQDWQDRAREEVMKVFGNKEPDTEGMNQLKVVTMILYEVLRLYPPVIQLNRAVHKEMKLGDLTVPGGVQINLPVLLVQRDTELWGDDAAEFKPERFQEGLSKATKSQVSFFPFGWGPRICIGQSYALLEAKMAMALILHRFSFELSPSYVHAPYTVITLHPQFGAHLLLHQARGVPLD
ncbi:unnamed protein product [Thlaspi arvense]|uniref:Cytochrome P450 n=1 Tax=Thlaspi arvense TaxID=13288 RepID=A0AAU9S266_THLAR|nr:unnamed protein product [Thlaspi arvense]